MFGFEEAIRDHLTYSIPAGAVMKYHRAALDHFWKPCFKIDFHIFVLVQAIDKNQFYGLRKSSRRCFGKLDMRDDYVVHAGSLDVALKFVKSPNFAHRLAVLVRSGMRIHRMNFCSAAGLGGVPEQDRGSTLLRAYLYDYATTFVIPYY